ncbi:MAG TPA: glycosyltransferase [Gammaproteobacteria bacterium]|nr:glycosyltransferase [Gammaproteobacteria bacterium]
MSISIIVPAHNEEYYLGGCLEAAATAARAVTVGVETVVVLNRCTDASERIAREHGAQVVHDASRCIAAVRNRGVAASSGEIIVTCDADSRLHPQMLPAVLQELERGAIGGGVDIRYDRRSRGIRATEAVFRLVMRATGISCGAFWTTRQAFDAVSGFDERLLIAEDVDLARRLREYGKARGLRYRALWETPLLTSSRKFDQYGDWSFFLMPLRDGRRIWRSFRRRDTEFVDEYFHDFNDEHKP